MFSQKKILGKKKIAKKKIFLMNENKSKDSGVSCTVLVPHMSLNNGVRTILDYNGLIAKKEKRVDAC
jgi:hypothetical protein